MPRQNETTERPRWSVAMLIIGGAVLLLLGLMSLMLSASSSYDYYTGTFSACQISSYPGGVPVSATGALPCTPFAVIGGVLAVLGFLSITIAIVMKHAHARAVRKLAYSQMALTVITLALIMSLNAVFGMFLAASGSILMYLALIAIPFQFIGSAYGITHM